MKKKLLAIFLIVCVLAITISTTSLAYFTDTKEIMNTYEVGNVTITLTETSQWNGKLYPGLSTGKDPTITNTGSEKAYVGAKVVISGKTITNEADFAALLSGGLLADGANAIVDRKVNGNAYEIYIVYKQELTTENTGKSVTLFETLSIPAQYTNDQMAQFKDMKITVTAYAVQSVGMTDALSALQAAFDVFDHISTTNPNP